MSTVSQKSDPANSAKVVRSVFVSHPTHTDISIIRRVLEGEGVAVRSDEDVKPSQPIRESLIEGMQKVDAVIAVLGNHSENASIFYQMGLADGMGKPVLVLSAGAFDPFSYIRVHPYLRARTDDEDALRFGLSHFFRAPHHGTTTERDYTSETKPLGEKVDGFLARLRSNQPIREDELVAIIATAIRESGVEAQASVSASFAGDEIPADIAV